MYITTDRRDCLSTARQTDRRDTYLQIDKRLYFSSDRQEGPHFLRETGGAI